MRSGRRLPGGKSRSVDASAPERAVRPQVGPRAPARSGSEGTVHAMGKVPLRPAMRLEQPGIRVRDLQRSVRFYRKALGLRVERRGDTRAWGGGKWVLLRDPRSGNVLELNWYPRGSLFHEPYRAGTALDHIDFTVGAVGRDVLERAYRTLVRQGAKPTRWRPATTGGWMACVKDPDGLWIKIGRRPQLGVERVVDAPGRRRRSPGTSA